MKEETAPLKVWSWKDAVVSSQLEPNTKFILLVLSLYMDAKGGSCYPTIDTLVKDSSLARATVIKHLALAEQAGFIRKKRHGFKGQEWANNEYLATYPKESELKKDPELDLEPGKKGSSAIELPSKASGSQKGSSAIEPALAEKAGSTDGQRQFNGQEKVVQPLNSNSPLTSPYNNTTPLTPQPGDVDKSANGVLKNMENGKGKSPPVNTPYRRPYRIENYLTDDARALARKKAPNFDLYYLMRVYDEGINKGERQAPDYPSSAFPRWCEEYEKGAGK